MHQRLVFSEKQKVALAPLELPALKAGEVLVRTEYSLMSLGTENIVFNRLFDPGTHWDNWVRYPFYPGYSAVGVVQATQSELHKVGDRVAARYGHQSHAVMAEGQCIRIPASVPMESAAWFALAKIAFHGALAAGYQFGDSVLIVGAGPIGQMSIRWARAAGAAAIIVVDPAHERMALAKAGGATATISLPIDQAKDAVLAANQGRLPRVVIDSTGNAKVFAAALGLADRFGRVVVLGDTGSPAGQQLTPDVIMKGLTIVGAHDGHETAQWSTATISAYFLGLAEGGRFSLDGLNTHFFQPEECAEAYAAANRDRARTMGIVFDWRIQK
jgi:2-desacetyl-2-hydroxyethyl bacteriochlorophyllide A dehydrogenase